MSPSPKVLVTEIPKIKALRSELDYGDPSIPRALAFINDINAFRRKFKTALGVDGDALHNWKDQATHLGLDEMVDAYLEREGNGQLFWPDDQSSKNYNKYQYSKDGDQYVTPDHVSVFRSPLTRVHFVSIHRLVKQLFFRLNLQQFQAGKYKKGKKTSSPDTFIDGSGISSGPNASKSAYVCLFPTTR